MIFVAGFSPAERKPATKDDDYRRLIVSVYEI
jgi:hypothetical protein